MSQFTTVTLTLLKGFGQTMNIFLLTLAFSIPLGLFQQQLLQRCLQCPFRRL